MQQIIEIAKKIKQAGGSLYLVGGAVRDKFIQQNCDIKNKITSNICNENQEKNFNKIQTHDEDYCVTGLSQEQFQNLFPEAKIQGKNFPVFIINKKEIALARTEQKIGKGHKNFSFNTNPKITIEEDLARRDLTINSIAQEILTGKIIDPFNGQEDIKNKILRKTTKAFDEDPLRVYRTARFAATLDFTVEPNTLEAMTKLKQELLTLSKERVFVEFKKALESNKPSIFFEILKKADVLEEHFLEIAMLIRTNSTRTISSRRRQLYTYNAGSR